jgi:hypothetical protein
MPVSTGIMRAVRENGDPEKQKYSHNGGKLTVPSEPAPPRETDGGLHRDSTHPTPPRNFVHFTWQEAEEATAAEIRPESERNRILQI